MKSSALHNALFGCALALFCTTASVRADIDALVILSENGYGHLEVFGGGTPGPVSSSLTADPGPGGLASALTFDLDPPSMVTGDLFIMNGASVEDIIRFDSSSGFVYFYSLLGGGQLADTGLPTLFYSNTLSIPEGAGQLTIYEPTFGQPGYVAGFDVIFHIDGSLTSVPEPSSALCGVALLGLVSFARSRRNFPLAS